LMVEERIPLKQGLKHVGICRLKRGNRVEERIPLKQGLKLAKGMGNRPRYRVEERIPLKQGLKLKCFNSPLDRVSQLKNGFH